MPHRLPIYTTLCILTAVALAFWLASAQPHTSAAQVHGQNWQPGRPSAPRYADAASTSTPEKYGGNSTAQAMAGLQPAHAPTQAETVLLSAIAMCESRKSLSAKLRLEGHFFGKQLVGSGNYSEENRSEDYLIRLELRTQSGGHSSTMVRVCDGRYLWTYRKMPAETTLTRVDLVRASAVLRRHFPNPMQPDSAVLPGLGGLAYLLRSIQAAFEFNTLEYGRWGRSKLVWRLTGQWNRKHLQALLPEQSTALEKGLPPDLSKLPEHLPDRVIIILGQDDLLPHRIEYRRRLPEKDGAEPTSRALLIVDLFDAQTNVKVDPAQFIYQPGDAKLTDATESFVQSLLRAEQP